MPLVVRNTFIDFNDRTPSLDEFFFERKVMSCPVSMISEPGSEADVELCDENVPPGQPTLHRSKTVGSTATTAPWRRAKLETPAAEVATSFATNLIESQDGTRSDCSTTDTVESTLPLTPENGFAPLMTLGKKVVIAPAPGPISADLSSLGSVGHEQGTCKPCAFLHSKGCTSGKNCQFCHLCDSGEKKRRQKDKRAFFSTIRQMTSVAWSGPSH